MADSNGNHKGILTPEEIAELRGSARTRNAYGPKLKDFIESDELGVNVREYWPEFAKKEVSTLYQGFHNFLGKADNSELSEQVETLRNGEDFYLIKK